MADYGEPWKYIDAIQIVDRDGKDQVPTDEMGKALILEHRAVACVNALAGVDDPAAFVAAVRTLVDSVECYDFEGCSLDHDALGKLEVMLDGTNP